MIGFGSWRDLLGKIIRDPQERQHVAHELGVCPLTLTRWVSGESTPRAQNVRLLLTTLPDYRQQFLELFLEEFGSSVVEAIDMDTLPQEISSAFYARVMHAHCTVSRFLRFGTICDLILQEAAKKLDPGHDGVQVTLIQCLPPLHGSQVRSLYESVGYGTYLWAQAFEAKNLLLGAETLAGHVVMHGEALSIERHSTNDCPHLSYWLDGQESALAYPIRLASGIAGCLKIASSQPDFFLLPARLKLIQHYVELLTIAFEPEMFYDPAALTLEHLPSYELQRTGFCTFRQRVIDAISHHHLHVLQAERLVLQQIEDELLRDRCS